MLTGDKLETAQCIAKSSKLVSKSQTLHVFESITNRTEAHLQLNAFRKKQDCCLVVTGDSLEVNFATIEFQLLKGKYAEEGKKKNIATNVLCPIISGLPQIL